MRTYPTNKMGLIQICIVAIATKSTKTSRNRLPSYNQATIFTLRPGKTTLLLKTRYRNFDSSSWFLFAFPKSFGQLRSNPSSIPFCNLHLTHKHGKTTQGSQRYYCPACRPTFAEALIASGLTQVRYIQRTVDIKFSIL